MINYTFRCKNGYFSSGEANRITIRESKLSIWTNNSFLTMDVDSIVELTANTEYKASPVDEVLADSNKASDVVNQGNAGQSLSEVTRKENAMKEANEIREQKEAKTDPTRKTTRKR